MKRKFSDRDVQKLLSNIKGAETAYPPELIESRRDAYKKQAAAMLVLLKAAGVGTNANDGGTASSAAAGGGTSSMGMVLQSALVFTLVLEVIVAAYVYRDKITDFVRTTFYPPTEVASGPVDDSSSTPAIIPITGNETATETPTPSVTVTATETHTPFPVIVSDTDTPLSEIVSETDTPLSESPAGDEGVADVSSATEEIVSTPLPTENPGNHYGNTPKPERTKEPGSNAPGNND